VSENGQLRKIFEVKVEVSEELKILYNEAFCDL